MAITSMRPVHPGEVLREEFLEPLGMTPSRTGSRSACVGADHQ
jgi:plasmid maintenance system antidote protein VapI